MAIISIPTSLGGISAQGELGSVLNGPLASLFGGKGVDTIKYPSDLATSATQSHYVLFSIKRVIPAGYESTTNTPLVAGSGVGGSKLASDLVSSSAPTIQKFVTDASNFATTIAGSNPIAQAAAQALADKAKSFGESASNGINVIAGLLKNGLKINPQTTQSVAYISLYMPDTLNSSFNAQYEELSLTSDNKINSLRMIEQMADRAYDAGSGGGFDGLSSQVMSTLSTDPAAVSLAIDAARKIPGFDISDNTKNLLLKGQGYAINPQLQMIYKGVDLRSFSLSFIFTPKSANEALNVQRILTRFKHSFSPSLQTGKTVSNESMFLIAPDIFNIQFKLNSAENKFLPRYGDCVLTAIDIDYAPNGWAAYSDGSPVQTKLSLSFKEVGMVTREDIDVGAGTPRYTNINAEGNPTPDFEPVGGARR